MAGSDDQVELADESRHERIPDDPRPDPVDRPGVKLETGVEERFEKLSLTGIGAAGRSRLHPEPLARPGVLERDRCEIADRAQLLGRVDTKRKPEGSHRGSQLQAIAGVHREKCRTQDRVRQVDRDLATLRRRLAKQPAEREHVVDAGGDNSERVDVEADDVIEHTGERLGARDVLGGQRLAQLAHRRNQERTGAAGRVEDPLVPCPLMLYRAEDPFCKPVRREVLPERVANRPWQQPLVEVLEQIASVLRGHLQRRRVVHRQSVDHRTDRRSHLR